MLITSIEIIDVLNGGAIYMIFMGIDIVFAVVIVVLLGVGIVVSIVRHLAKFIFGLIILAVIAFFGLAFIFAVPSILLLI